MAQHLNIEVLTEEAVRMVPDELQEDVRNWLDRAGKGELSQLSQELAKKVQELCRAFESAAKKVEEKLQQ
jgi:hypothetical protein